MKTPPEQAPTKLKGRPRVKVAFETLLKHHKRGLGWRLTARAYTEETGQFISPSTVRRLVLAHLESGQQ